MWHIFRKRQNNHISLYYTSKTAGKKIFEYIFYSYIHIFPISQIGATKSLKKAIISNLFDIYEEHNNVNKLNMIVLNLWHIILQMKVPA